MSAPLPRTQPDIADAAPRPWRSIQGDSQICDKNGMFVADVAQGISGTCWPTSRANARLTVVAVNNHETLLNNVEVMKRHMSGAADEIAALKSRVEELTRALEKVRSYNVDIAACRINYRPFDHIQVIDEALAMPLEGRGGAT